MLTHLEWRAAGGVKLFWYQLTLTETCSYGCFWEEKKETKSKKDHTLEGNRLSITILMQNSLDNCFSLLPFITKTYMRLKRPLRIRVATLHLVSCGGKNAVNILDDRSIPGRNAHCPPPCWTTFLTKTMQDLIAHILRMTHSYYHTSSVCLLCQPSWRSTIRLSPKGNLF